MTDSPEWTPWGHPDSVTELAPGIVSYSTPSHGGIWLSPERVAEMPKPLREFVPFGGPQAGPGRWFEEDCDWSVVAAAFPEYFDAEALDAAMKTLERWKTELHAQVAGKSRWSIHYADREMAREHGDPQLGTVLARSKEEAEAEAQKDGQIVSRSVPCASLWAVEVRGKGDEARR